MSYAQIVSRKSTTERHYLETRVWEYSLLCMAARMAQTSLEWPGEILPNFNLASQLRVIVSLISPALCTRCNVCPIGSKVRFTCVPYSMANQQLLIQNSCTNNTHQYYHATKTIGIKSYPGCCHSPTACRWNCCLHFMASTETEYEGFLGDVNC